MKSRRRGIENCSRVRDKRFVLDTSVIVEYVIQRSMYRPRVAKLFELATTGEVELFVSPITLSEVLYIVSRIYEVAGIDNPNDEALNYMLWVTRRVKVVQLNEDIVIRAGELKKRLRIALPDCYVIALAQNIDAIPLFKFIEKEMKPVLDELRRLGVKFLEEIRI